MAPGGSPPIRMLDGRFGLVTACNPDEAGVTFPGHEPMAWLPWEAIVNLGGGALAALRPPLREE